MKDGLSEKGDFSPNLFNELYLVDRIIQQAGQAEALDDLFEEVATVLVNRFGLSGGGIYLLDEKTGKAVLRHHENLPGEFVQKVCVVDPEVPPYSRVYQSNLPIVTHDYAFVSPETAKTHGIKAAVVVPLVHNRRAIGSLNLIKADGPFTESEVGMLMAIGHSIGFAFQRLEHQETLGRMNQNLFRFFNTLEDLLFVLDREGTIIEVNDSVLKKLGFSKEELVGESVVSIHFPEDREKARRIVTDMIAGKSSACPLPLRRRNGRSLEVETRVTPGFWDGREVLYGISRDLTETVQIARIRYLYEHDPLTELLNRGAFECALYDAAMVRRFPLSIVIMDINGFRVVNDAYGHREGDKVLKVFAGRISNCCRPQDLLARWGGDEFALFLPDTGRSEALEIAEGIKGKAAVIYKGSLELGISFGVATLEGEDICVEKAVAEAEDMMFRHKLFVEKSIQHSLIASIQRTIEERHLETEQHTERMVALAEGFGRHLGLEKNELNDLRLFATLHDIGKVGISDKILLKKGPLNDREWIQMKKHSAIGSRIAEATKILGGMSELILYHHERWDGGGYPEGLAGKAIPKLCRILALVDAFDVMTHDRPYKLAISQEAALLEIRRCSGTQFDPDLAAEFFSFMVRSG